MIQMPLDRPRILVVEDERVVAMDLEHSLVQLGYQVVGIADESDEALRMIEATKPDLVLMDIQISGGQDGISTAEEIRNRWQIPVVFATAHTSAETLNRAKGAGPLGFVTKPFRERELNAAIVIALHQHRLLRDWFAEHAWLTTLLASLGEGVIATDEAGTVRYMNHAAECLTEWAAEEASDKPIDAVYPLLTRDGEAVERCQLRRALDERRPIQPQVFQLVARSGRRLLVEDVAAPIVDAHGQVTGAATVFLDVTERERLTREMERSNEELSRFSYAVSHDPQAPLRSIRNLAELLVTQTAGQASSEQAKLLCMITDAAQGMQRLVASLLAYAQVGQGTVTREPVAIQHVVATVEKILAPAIAYFQANIRCSTLPVIDADRVRMEQLFQNLIDNAIKYRRTDAAPVLTITSENLPDGWQFAVRDNGQGIPPHQAEVVFRPLKRLHGSEVPGTGLGLALCRSIVERYGGRIWIDYSGAEQGTVIRFSIKRQRSD